MQDSSRTTNPLSLCKLGQIQHPTEQGETWAIEHWTNADGDFYAARTGEYYLCDTPTPPFTISRATRFGSAEAAGTAAELRSSLASVVQVDEPSTDPETDPAATTANERDNYSAGPTPLADLQALAAKAREHSVPIREAFPGGLTIPRTFSRAGKTPYEETEWREVDVAIKDAAGETIWAQTGVQVPAAWSDQAAQIVASKYFHGDPDKGRFPEDGGREIGVGQLVHRVCTTIANWGYVDGYFATPADCTRFYDELSALCLGQYAAFNSPVWFNLGLHRVYGLTGSANGWVWDAERGEAVPCTDALKHPQCSACFIQSVRDDMTSICDLASSEMMLFKYGSGTGTDLSPLRSSREKLSGGGKPSGPVSFMRVYDAGAAIVKSGGRSRRAAKMQTLRCDHPDVLDFIHCKVKEERKAQALIAAGYSAGMTGSPDEAYSSVCYQNANLSVRVTDEFMRKATSQESYQGNGSGPDCYFALRAVTTGDVIEEVRACSMLDDIAEATWICGDPGIQYHDTIQRWHTCPNTAPINSSNPCSEFLFVDDSACNLASINLMKFRREDGTFDVDRFRIVVRLLIIAQDILVDRSSYPTKAIAENSHRFRPLGLGYANLGALIMANGLPYDSDAARDLAGAITSVMGAQAYLTSAEIAGRKGPFTGFEANAEPMRRVIQQHYAAARGLYCHSTDETDTERLAEIGYDLWLNAAGFGHENGFRNSQVTVLAPTGTIAFMMDCTTTGVEPETALVKYKTLAGGGQMKIVNGIVPTALHSLGYESYQVDQITAHIGTYDTIEDVLKGPSEDAAVWSRSGLKSEHLPVFDCAFPARPGGRSIVPIGHLKMMAAVQPFLSGAISKSVNMPADATVQDIRDAYAEGWRLGLKAVAIYRDGSKGQQPLRTTQEKPDTPAAPAPLPQSEVQDLAERMNEVSALFDAPGRLGPTVSAAPDAPAWRVGDWHHGPTDLVYRDGSDRTIGTLEELAKLANLTGQPPAARRDRLPDTRRSLTHKFVVGGHEGYVTVGFFPDGRVGELFVRMAKEGSTIGGLMDQLATAISIGLQHGVPLEVFVNKLAYTSFEPSGFTPNPDVPIAKSLTDYLGRWLGCEFVAGYRAEHAPHRDPVIEFDPAHERELHETVSAFVSSPARGPLVSMPAGSAEINLDAFLRPEKGVVSEPASVVYEETRTVVYQTGPLCDRCGHMMIRTGACHACPNCGASGGCGG